MTPSARHQLEDLIAEWREEAIAADTARDSGDNIEWDAGKAIRSCADELSALVRAFPLGKKDEETTKI